ncbi:hypothetical protein FRC17_005020 [Serendipita sp. 399]|nr:hypothetical protein FRC17_005020 [Serendipita sp. 399]
MENLKAPYAIAGAVATTISAYIYFSSRTNEAKAKQVGARLPPGPKRVFLLGNLLNFPKDHWYKTFTSWGKQYEAAEDLAGKRAAIYSGRPYMRMLLDLMGAGFSMVFTQPSAEFNEQRKLFRISLGPQIVGNYDRLIQQRVESFIGDMHGFEGDPHPQVARTFSTILTVIAYGEKFYSEHGEALVQLNIENTHLLSWALTKFWAVDVVAFLRYVPSWVPGANFQRVARTSSDQVQRVRFWPFGYVKGALTKGTADDSLVSKLLADSIFAESTIRDAAAIMYSAGTDTTSTMLINLFYNLVLHPEWQAKLQEELDDVVGRGHLPTAQDVPKLRILDVIWKESFRLHPPVPLGIAFFERMEHAFDQRLGIPHVSTEADVYNGLYIPKGSMIHCNIGAMMRDPRVWGEDCNEFNPSRFLPEINPQVENLPDISTIPFGFGRRLCPGRFLAERAGRQLAASVMSTYTLLPVKDAAITSTMPFEDTTISRPLDFKCHFKPRFD